MTRTCIVADAGPLIALARIGQIELPRRLFATVVVPTAVYAECVRMPQKAGAAAIGQAVETGRLVVRSPSQPGRGTPSPRLGTGEWEAIMLALELSCPVLLDDKLARAHARHAGVAVIGTGGLPVAAKAEALIPAVGPLLEELRLAGYRFSEELVTRILELAGEG